MKTVVVKDFGGFTSPDAFILDLAETPCKDCLGCWTCWWTTPGKCVHRDLDDFFRAYIAADKAIFFAKITRDFVSGNMKTLFDRMICLFLPYTIISQKRRTRHLPRYDRYPDIEFYYEGTFDSEESRQIFFDYITYLFKEFYSETVSIKPISELETEVSESCAQ